MSSCSSTVNLSKNHIYKVDTQVQTKEGFQTAIAEYKLPSHEKLELTTIKKRKKWKHSSRKRCDFFIQ